MVWYVYVGWFFAGAFLTNAIPHIVQGMLRQSLSDAVRLAARRR